MAASGVDEDVVGTHVHIVTKYCEKSSNSIPTVGMRNLSRARTNDIVEWS